MTTLTQILNEAKRIILDENGSYHDLVNSDSSLGVDMNETDISCGINQISELSHHATPKDQALLLAQALLDGRDDDDTKPYIKPHPKRIHQFSRQVIFSDRVNNGKNWAAAKHFAHKGPITINPNSKNAIQLFIVTMNDLVNIYNYKPKK